MLDAVLVFHTGGLVLWSKYYYSLKGAQDINPIDYLVSEVLLKGRDYASGNQGEAGSSTISVDPFSIQYLRDNDNNLVFAVI